MSIKVNNLSKYSAKALNLFLYYILIYKHLISYIISKQDDYLVPPKRIIFIGDGDFRDIGNEFLKYFADYGNLKPDDRVLDVGCGIGRMALPLTNYLSDKGEYWGFDIVKEGIDWCRTIYPIRFKNFHFQLADIYNRTYNHRGYFQASNYKFPYENSYFDFIFLTSVFTHMLLEEIENYISEISRVIKPNKNFLATFFLLNSESLGNINSSLSSLEFKFEIDGGLTTNSHTPEDAVAFDENIIKEIYEKHGLEIYTPIHYGAWCGRDCFVSYQDIIIATKRGK
ncbi:methyltransferase domain-containing protein [Chlorogloeopsis sp. ULAP01]|uniref:class I SAM-dependent methyltransferase n=1 Tax=Chlorogloeopsis sp. ULAP01 TaxID=3056483 RepID=UPI0025AA88D2|nr:class I SAM-dependent methyltransferase [Chlorogloeopsis sp. ULAP01]MDM9384357.1 methyltransferase domain-containing protein [Chlorogloeopsis sp. ULAP01]